MKKGKKAIIIYIAFLVVVSTIWIGSLIMVLLGSDKFLIIRASFILVLSFAALISPLLKAIKNYKESNQEVKQ